MISRATTVEQLLITYTDWLLYDLSSGGVTVGLHWLYEVPTEGTITHNDQVTDQIYMIVQPLVLKVVRSSANI
jgi:hypothetical protein